MDNDDIDAMFDEGTMNEDQLTTEENANPTGDTPSGDGEDSQEAPQKEDEQASKAEDGEENPRQEDGSEEKKTEQPEDPTKENEESKVQEEAPAPLTKDDIRSAIADIRNEERNSGKEIDDLTGEIMKTYYPDGLSNVLVDANSGKELKSPQDVIDAGYDMTVEEATRWLINEQYKLDRDINNIKDQARSLAETNANFRSGANRVLDKYKDVFDKFPEVQQKAYKAYMKQVKIDEKNQDLILSAPDIEEYYDLVMEPYVMAHGHLQNNTSNKPAPQNQASGETPPAPQIPESRQTVDDRLDEGGDAGGINREADPNNPDDKLDELFGNG